MKLLCYVQIFLSWFGLVLTASSNSNVGIQDNFPFTSVVDILSQNVEFSTFLRAVQRNGFIPYLNELQNYTLMAPVNSAFIDNEPEDKNYKFDIENYLIHDSVLLTSGIDQGISVISEGVKFPYVLEKLSDDTIIVNDVKLVDSDLLPNFQNASVHGIGEKINTPFGLRNFLQKIEHDFNDFHLFNNFTRNIPAVESITTNRTILIPSDYNWHNFFSEVEINYITDAFNSLQRMEGDTRYIWNTDRQNFIQNIIIDKILGGMVPDVHYPENLNGDPLDFQSERNGSVLLVNGSKSSDLSNMAFNRGLVHSFDNLEIIKDIISFTAEKYLHGINCSDFVRELYFRNLQCLIRDSRETQGEEKTIFVPDVPSAAYDGFSRPGLLYHFVGSKIWLDQEFSEENLGKSRMFESKFCDSDENLGGNCQRIKIIKDRGEYFINEKYRVIHEEPFQIGNTLIYLVSDKMKLPGDLTPSINPFYGCSRSLMFLSQLNILDLPLNKEGYTILMPCFDSWEFLELNLQFLENNMTAINSIMKNLIIDGLIYSDSKDTTFETKNLLGDSILVQAERLHNGEGTELNLNLSSVGTKIKIKNDLDLFFSQGVVHPLGQLYLPKSVTVTLIDLIRTTGTTQLIELFEKFDDLSSIIHGNKPYSLLVPTESSLSLVGDILNSTKLLNLLKLHVIEGDFTSSLLHCEGNVTTLLGDSLFCRKDSQENYFLGVLNGAQREVRIMKKGCSSHNSCVFLIDRPISLQWLNRRKIWFGLPRSPLGIAMLTETVILFIGLSLFFFKRKKVPGTNLVSPNNDDAEITRPLIAPGENTSPDGRNET
ncbi:hypothetical protein ZYGR_0H02630 [Zygosaccharomyces rouxii]|uniref:ZYRO0B10054p n=2 Tax=Zygosaccharomyces rouxii TaxID=4956 RepID=C5DRP2_ZYGRC|nr:uncharacterized protein ZYRO0B10054g [Zygosaccharomyces rouxii]KAH9200012.1 hypothetical protein LQ764DRAFT_234585 [Zygosaccharomyces rouxii]GAV47421.1 hypothetical protein ZYGR_0H02630 [Zygosaccharomyces rouxii]CAR26453.1 ZYRO0B10054p [Zygosaccharomyces rouxii]